MLVHKLFILAAPFASAFTPSIQLNNNGGINTASLSWNNNKVSIQQPTKTQLGVSFSSPRSSTEIPSAEICPQSVTSPNGSPNPWEVHKFGGASRKCKFCAYLITFFVLFMIYTNNTHHLNIMQSLILDYTVQWETY